jgi:hypothetical protein
MTAVNETQNDAETQTDDALVQLVEMVEAGEIDADELDEALASTDEVETPSLPYWRHRPTVAYVRMVVERREAKGDLSKTALAKFAKALYEKHGLPHTATGQAKYEAQLAKDKQALKDEAKRARREARLAARAAAKAAKLEAAAQADDDEVEDVEELDAEADEVEAS